MINGHAQRPMYSPRLKGVTASQQTIDVFSHHHSFTFCVRGDDAAATGSGYFSREIAARFNSMLSQVSVW